jgi:hypothetical protein
MNAVTARTAASVLAPAPGTPCRGKGIPSIDGKLGVVIHRGAPDAHGDVVVRVRWIEFGKVCEATYPAWIFAQQWTAEVMSGSALRGYVVKMACGDHEIRLMREETAGIAWSPEAVIETTRNACYACRMEG